MTTEEAGGGKSYCVGTPCQTGTNRIVLARGVLRGELEYESSRICEVQDDRWSNDGGVVGERFQLLILSQQWVTDLCGVTLLLCT